MVTLSNELLFLGNFCSPGFAPAVTTCRPGQRRVFEHGRSRVASLNQRQPQLAGLDALTFRTRPECRTACTRRQRQRAIDMTDDFRERDVHGIARQHKATLIPATTYDQVMPAELGKYLFQKCTGN